MSSIIGKLFNGLACGTIVIATGCKVVDEYYMTTKGQSFKDSFKAHCMNLNALDSFRRFEYKHTLSYYTFNTPIEQYLTSEIVTELRRVLPSVFNCGRRINTMILMDYYDLCRMCNPVNGTLIPYTEGSTDEFWVGPLKVMQMQFYTNVNGDYRFITIDGMYVALTLKVYQTDPQGNVIERRPTHLDGCAAVPDPLDPWNKVVRKLPGRAIKQTQYCFPNGFKKI